MEIKTSASYLRCEKCADVYTESVTDYLLPDYLGDVRKILFTEASVRPSGKFASGDEVELSGVVVYNIMYLDGEGQLCSAEFTSDYDYSVKCSGEEYSDSVADTRVSGYSVRVVGPRKINARASLVGSVRLCERKTVEALGDAFTGEYLPEVNMGRAQVRACRTSALCEREYAEQLLRLDGAIADEVSVVHSAAECQLEELSPEEDAVTFKGRLRVTSVIKNAEEPAYLVEKIIPFEEKCVFDGVTPTMHLTPRSTVSSLGVNVNADEGGCELVASVILELSCLGEENQWVDLMLDGYLKECSTDNRYESFDYTRLLDGAQLKCSHTAELSRSDIEAEGLHEIVFLSASPKLERIEREGGRVTLIGEVKYSGVVSEMNGESLGYSGVKFSSPFSINVNSDCQIDEKTQVEASLSCFNTVGTLDSERLYASCSIEGDVTFSCVESCTVLSSMTVCEGDEVSPSSASITVYYPTEGDTLFSVSKRYRTSGLKVARDNDISESVFAPENPTGSLAGVKRLIIY